MCRLNTMSEQGAAEGKGSWTDAQPRAIEDTTNTSQEAPQLGPGYYQAVVKGDVQREGEGGRGRERGERVSGRGCSVFD